MVLLQITGMFSVLSVPKINFFPNAKLKIVKYYIIFVLHIIMHTSYGFEGEIPENLPRGEILACGIRYVTFIDKANGLMCFKI